MNDAHALKVLVADDDPDILELVCLRLEMVGLETMRAHDGVEALELARREAPALCVLDVRMPRLNGFEVLAGLRASDPTVGVPVIMLTASVQDGDFEFALESGADDCVRKPFDPTELQTRVLGLLRRAEAEEVALSLTGASPD
jgi:DNA-binding response OmpR family regulator